MKIIVSMLLLTSITIVSCHHKVYTTKSEAGKASPVVASAGEKLYLSHCGSCHSFYLPSEFNAMQWNTNLNNMQARAKINDDEKKLIYMYLTSKL